MNSMQSSKMGRFVLLYAFIAALHYSSAQSGESGGGIGKLNLEL